MAQMSEGCYSALTPRGRPALLFSGWRRLVPPLEALHMAPVTNLYKLAFSGRLFAVESWSCSLHVDAPSGLNLAASNFLAPLQAWFGAVGTKNSVQAKLDEVKFNQINPVTARYTLPTSNNLLQMDASTGNTSAGPGQNSLVISFRTALDRGRGHVGRIYPPTGAIAVTSDGRVASADASALAGTTATLLNAINSTVAVGAGRVVVFSKIGQLVEPVTAVRVGRVMDTMRSRRASQLEDGQTTVLA